MEAYLLITSILTQNRSFEMKRFSSLILAAWMCVAIVGCSEEAGTGDAPAETPATESSDAGDSGSESKEEASEEAAE